jgi:hypothetical protein
MMHVLERVTARDLVTGRPRTRVANADDQHLGSHGPESVEIL